MARIGWYAGWAFGATMTNLGKASHTDNVDMKDFIPANPSRELHFTKNFNDQNKLTFGLDTSTTSWFLPPPLRPQRSQCDCQLPEESAWLPAGFSSFRGCTGGFSEEIKEFQVSVGGEYWYNSPVCAPRRLLL